MGGLRHGLIVSLIWGDGAGVQEARQLKFPEQRGWGGESSTRGDPQRAALTVLFVLIAQASEEMPLGRGKNYMEGLEGAISSELRWCHQHAGKNQFTGGGGGVLLP